MRKPRKTSFARTLRHNQTDAERLLWAKLRDMQTEGIKFRRQAPIGTYIVDFVCFDKKMIVELDGGQHNEVETIEKDKQRTAWLESQCFRVIRFWDNDVLLNIDGVTDKIREAVD